MHTWLFWNTHAYYRKSGRPESGFQIPDSHRSYACTVRTCRGKKSGQKRSYLPTVIQKEIFCVSLICTSHKKHSRDRQPFRCRCNIFFSIPGKHTESQTYSLLLYTNGSFWQPYIHDPDRDFAHRTRGNLSVKKFYRHSLLWSRNWRSCFTICHPGKGFWHSHQRIFWLLSFRPDIYPVKRQSMGFCRYTVFYQPAWKYWILHIYLQPWQ